MECKVSELVKRGHDQAVELKSSCGAVDVRDVAQLISDLASQLDVQRVRVEESQREFRAADATIENLQMQVEKLAAENAGLKQGTPDLQTMMSALDAFFADEEVPERAMLAAHNILRGAVETPATDSFLAEVRAQGVEMLNTQFKKCTGMLNADSVVSTAEHFADQLRKGVQS